MNEDAYHTTVKPNCSGCRLMLFRANFRCYFAVSRFFGLSGTLKLIWTGFYLTSFTRFVKIVLIQPWSNFLVLLHQGMYVSFHDLDFSAKNVDMKGQRSDGDKQDNEIKKCEEVVGCDCPRSVVTKFFLHGSSEAENFPSEQKVFWLRGIVLMEDLEDGVQLQNKVIITTENSYGTVTRVVSFGKGRHHSMWLKSVKKCQEKKIKFVKIITGLLLVK